MAHYYSMVKSFLLALIMVTILGCAAAETPQQSPGVQDIAPGDKSVISSPGAPAARTSDVHERNI